MQRRVSALQQLYNLLYNLGLISIRPTASLRVPKPWKRVKVPPPRISELVISAIGVESPFDIRDRAVLLMLRDGGIRAEAVARCEVANIDWKLGRIMLRDDKYGKDHWVPVSKRCLAAITLYLKKAHAHFLRGRELPFMFPSAQSDGPMTRQRIWQIAGRWTMEVLGIKVSPHAWRRALLTEGSESGMELFDLMQMAGHLDPATTQRYLRHSDGKLREVLQDASTRGKGAEMTVLSLQLRKQVIPEQAHGTMREMIEQYFRWKDLAVASPHTKKAYHFEVSRLMKFIGQDSPTSALNSISLHHFSSELCKIGLAPRSRRRALAYARDLIRWAAQAGIYLDNFALSLKMPRLSRSMPKVPTQAEMKAMLAGACPTAWPLRDRCIAEFLYCNLRVFEVVAIELDDVVDEDKLLVKGKGRRERYAFLTESAEKHSPNIYQRGPHSCKGVTSRAMRSL